MPNTAALPLTRGTTYHIAEDTIFAGAPFPLKSALFDIDGTLVGPDHSIAARTRRALDALKAMGVKVGFATGRANFATESIAKDLEITGASMFFAGSLIQDLTTGKTLYRVELPHPAISKLLTLARTHNYHIELYTESDFYAERMTEELVVHQQYCAKPALLAPLRDVMAELPIIKSVIMTTVGEGEALLRQRLSEIPEIVVTYSYGAAHAHVVFANIVNAQATRTAAFNELLKINGCSAAEVATFGDAEADCEFLKAARFGVALDNAAPAAKAAASFITTRVEDGGVGLAIEKLFLG